MLEDLIDKVRLYDTDPNKGLCLGLYSEDLTKIEMFKGLCMANLPRVLNWFHQCNSETYQMFEFWTPAIYPARRIGQMIAEELQMPFEVDLSKSYLEGKEGWNLNYRNWDSVSVFHNFGLFFG